MASSLMEKIKAMKEQHSDPNFAATAPPQMSPPAMGVPKMSPPMPEIRGSACAPSNPDSINNTSEMKAFQEQLRMETLQNSDWREPAPGAGPQPVRTRSRSPKAAPLRGITPARARTPGRPATMSETFQEELKRERERNEYLRQQAQKKASDNNSGLANFAALSGPERAAQLAARNDGNPVRTPSNKVFAGNLPAKVTKKQLQYVFQNYGTVKDIILMQGKSHSGHSCAIIEYTNEAEARTSILTLHQKYEIKRGEGPIVVRWSEKEK